MSSLNGLSNVTLLTLDVVKSAVEAVTKQTGGTLDYLVSNAGRNHFMPILDEDPDTVRNLFEINLMGPIALTQAFAPLLIKAKGMTPNPLFFLHPIPWRTDIKLKGTYASSKRSLELAPFGVGVLEVVTGEVQTMGQTYFGNFQLLAQSLYKSIEDTIASRAQGKEGMPRMDMVEYATAVVDEITKRATGRFWYDNGSATIRYGEFGIIPRFRRANRRQDAGAVMGTGLDALGK
ncbi:hypothetical protein F4781DRAFT_9690 [Annulohypoxylon bovei var. microspora]|nr:hypothetical protein F4781DRAFT_9690 [Annulohypoxylon bovei var. microspora]